MEPGALLRSARTNAGLSARALASRSHVSVSTITRIEAGRVDPTFGTLRKLLEATGQDLDLTAKPNGGQKTQSLGDLSSAWINGPAGERPDWTRLRAFLDHLALHPEQIPDAISRRPRTSRSKLMNALLAGIADKLADDHQLPRPPWTATAPRLEPLWQTPGTARMQAAAVERTPPQLLERGLAISVESLWRERTTVGA